MPKSFLPVLIGTLCALIEVVTAQVPYEVVKRNPIEEPWRWHELEALSELYLTCGVEDEEGKLWLGYEGGVASYDGRVVRHFPSSELAEDARTYSLFSNGTDDVILFTSGGLMRLKDQKWQMLVEYEAGYYSSRNFAATNSHGLTVFATPVGLYQLSGEGVELVADFGERVFDIAFDNADNLWLVLGGEVRILKYANVGRSFPDSSTAQTYALDEQVDTPEIVYNSFEDELLFHSWKPSLPAYRYDKEIDGFLEEDPIGDLDYHNHVTSVSVERYGFLIFSKSALYNRVGGQWSEVLARGELLPLSDTFAFRRSNGNLVLGGHGESVYEIHFADERWESFPGLHFQCEGKNGKLWFISLEGKIVEYDSVTQTAQLHDSGPIDTPVAILGSRDGTIWVSGSHDGVAAVSFYDGEKWTRHQHEDLGRSIGHLSGIELISGEICFGSGSEYVGEHGGMVTYFTTDYGYGHSYLLNPAVPRRIAGMAQSKEGEIWMSGPRLWKFSLPDFRNLGLAKDLGVRWLDHITTDQEGTFWGAAWEFGLLRIKDGESTLYGRDEGLESEQVLYVLNDEYRPGTTWVATRLGISRFEDESWINNVLPRGFQFLREGATLKQDGAGDIWINTANRDWFFRTRNSDFEHSSLKEKFKSVRYRPDTQAPVVTLLEYPRELVSSANIRFAWEAKDYWSLTSEGALEYSYRLDDEDWSVFSKDTSVILTDLSNGEHTLELRVRDRDGNEGRIAEAATFSVIPPLWQRVWFILTLVSVLLVIVVLVVLLVRQRVQGILRLEEFKLQFFTNLSHELRTPISLILGPLEQFLSKYSDKEGTSQLKLAQKNALKLHHLVEQILEFRRFEVSAIQLQYARADLIGIIKNAIANAEPLSQEKKQEVFLVSQLTDYEAWFDPDSVEKILDNLIQNAIKYTEAGGEIFVKATIDEEESNGAVLGVVTVEDNGIGIPENKVAHIFDPFYRVKETHGQKNRGSGLGLALTKNLVERCGGRIQVKSPVVIKDGKAKGTRFVVTLPLLDKPPSSMQTTDEADAPEVLGSSSQGQIPKTVTAEKDSENTTDDRPKILLVEDDPDMRAYLKSELEEGYQILEAKDGNGGLMVAAKEIPDLIVSDVMMPEMDGNDFCWRIKNDEITSHIPVFMLTALKANEHELKSLGKGADDYFTKPVNFPILKQRIRNLFEYRGRLHERYGQLKAEQSIDTKEITSNSLDESFLNRAMRNIDEHLDDPLFDVEALAGLMHMSRMTLYRKFKALTGEAPSGCIRSKRMTRAAELLETGTYNVSEVSDKIGMQDVAYFCTMFKKFHGVTPGDFMAKSKDVSTKE
ncbi:ATP-binding protein [Pelagicoccus mobilis]|uniref:histidine kinase n=1 Tax=Pelagicoccus mobilis TaxID=415221 RepID=A0A934RYR8_9BACT|nr:ATP-binding protein [Pelagicoccus mobilis]MBK1875988.1 response regulator [Pelagicoccus mobilis]